MDEDDVRRILTGAAGGPPMRLDAADVIARGGRVRRRRKRWAVAGSSVATAAVIAVAGFAVGHRPAGPAPVEPARPQLSTVATTPPPAITGAPAPPSSALTLSPDVSRVSPPTAATHPTRRPSPTGATVLSKTQPPAPGATRTTPELPGSAPSTRP